MGIAKMNTDAFESSTSLPTTGEFVKDSEGRVCPVLDVNSIDVSSAVWGRKKGVTQVIRAKGGEKLGQKFEDGAETFEYEAKEGDAIFVNSSTDQYVPAFEDGRLQVDNLEKAGFEIANQSEDSQQFQVTSPKSKLLPGIVDARICIKGAWGDPSDEANHQFLSKGATLKVRNDGSISSGMDKEGFEKWEIIPSYEVQSNIPRVK